ncbi:hypothetical protein Tco_1077470 [Tanacetum coccineum]
MENLNLFYQDIGKSTSTGRHLTQEEAAKEALAIKISQNFALLEEILTHCWVEKNFRRLYAKMGKSNRNKRKSMENLNFFYQDIGTSSSTRRHLTHEEATKEALALRISQKFALLEEVRLVLETITYHDKYKKVLDEI